MVRTVPTLFHGFGSRTREEAPASANRRASHPRVGAVSWIRYVTEAPDASVTRGHESEFRQRRVACGEAETNEAPHGITKSTPTSVAVPGPAFVTVRV